MKPFEIVAHRGVTTDAPENTIEAFQCAVELGADAIELDVRLTSDRIPVVYHYFYLKENTSLPGAIFEYTFEQLSQAEVFCRNNPSAKTGRISTLSEILEIFGGKIGLEIEIKGPEPEASEIIGEILNQFQGIWSTIEVTSYESALLLSIKKFCPGLTTDLLFPRSESWMNLDVVQYQALHHARLAQARAVHLHPSQLSDTVVSTLRQQGIDIHAWDVNDEQSLTTVAKLGIARICTDHFEQARAFRERIHP